MYRLQSLTQPFLDNSTSCRADRRSDPTPNDTRTSLTRSRQSDVHEKGVGCVARSDIDPPYGKASSATPVSGARKRAPRRVRRSRSKAQAASRLRALTGEETNSSRSQGAAMAIGSNPLRSTILSMTYRDGQRIEVHPVVRLTLLDRLRTHEGPKGSPPTHPTQIRPHGLGALKAGQ